MTRTGISATSRVDRLALAIILAAFVIRVVGLNAQSLYNEEGYSIWLSQLGAERIFTQTAGLDSNTPLHYLLLGAWISLGGASEFSTRLLSVMAGMLTVALAYLLARLIVLGGAAPARWAAATLSVWPISVALSQESRMYGLLLSLNMLAVVGLLCGMRYGKSRYWLIWGTACVAAFGTHVWGAVSFAAQSACILIWWFATRASARIKYYPSKAPLAAVAVTGACITGWIAVILAVSVPTSTTYGGGLSAGMLLMRAAAANAMPPLRVDSEVMLAAIAIVALVAAGLALGNARLRFVLVMALATVAGIVVLSSWTGKYSWRYGAIFAAVIATGVAIAWRNLAKHLACSMRHQPIYYVVCPLLILSSASAFLLWRIDPNNANEDFRGAANYLRIHATSDEAIVLLPDFSAVFEYYYGTGEWYPLPQMPMIDVKETLDYSTAVPALNRALTGKQGAWLLIFDEMVMDPTHLTQALLRRQSQAFGPVLDMTAFHGLRLLHYRFFRPYQPLPEQIFSLQSRIESSGAQKGLIGLGCKQFDLPHAGDAWMEVACYWRLAPQSDLPFDTKVSLRLFGDLGTQVLQSDQNLAFLGLPYMAYDKPITGFYILNLPADLPAGQYHLRVIPYTDVEQLSPQVVTPIQILQHAP